ncbi:MAG: SWF/SNF helicase family protein [Clostridiales bacterium]|nr:SWF/SNF helicase family protein [Clostridiales bacterium]
MLTKLLRLSQATGGHLTDDEGKGIKISTAKLEALSDITDSVTQDGKKLVVMVRFIAEMDEIEKLLQKKHIGYAVIRGGVKDRQGEVDRFQNDSECCVFLGQIAAAGVGITLTAANTMVFYSLDYSMSNFEQAKARVHRVSQKEDCYYIYLQAKNTVDSKVLKSLRDKANLASLLVDEYRQGRNPFSV